MKKMLAVICSSVLQVLCTRVKEILTDELHGTGKNRTEMEIQGKDKGIAGGTGAG